MMRIIFHIAIGVVLLASMATRVMADDAPVRKNGSTAVRAKSILGVKVAIRGGTSVGIVEDIILSNEGVVDYLIVSKDGKLVTVPWDAARFDHEKRIATLDIAREVYDKIPTYTSERYPEFYEPAYRRQLFRHFELIPGRERRLERRLERRP